MRIDYRGKREATKQILIFVICVFALDSFGARKLILSVRMRTHRVATGEVFVPRIRRLNHLSSMKMVLISFGIRSFVAANCIGDAISV